MYAGVADIAGGILFTDGVDYSDVTVGRAFFDFDGDRLGRIRYDSPMFGPVQCSRHQTRSGRAAGFGIPAELGVEVQTDPSASSFCPPVESVRLRPVGSCSTEPEAA